MEWSIHEVARLTGTTSRTLRHYDDIGLLAPSRVGSNGYRHYDDAALVRLQRILLLRELGVGLSRIAEVLERRTDPAEALRVHLDWLRREQERTAQQIASVEATIASLEGGEQIMAEKMFDGFDHAVPRRGRAALGQRRVRAKRCLVARNGCRREDDVAGAHSAAGARLGRRRGERRRTRLG